MQAALTLNPIASVTFGLNGGPVAHAAAGAHPLGMGRCLPYTAILNRGEALYPPRGAAMSWTDRGTFGRPSWLWEATFRIHPRCFVGCKLAVPARGRSRGDRE